MKVDDIFFQRTILPPRQCVSPSIINILDKKARRVFAKKELWMMDEEVDEIEQEEDTISDFMFGEEDFGEMSQN